MTTQFANGSYQEVIDLHTEADRVSVIGIHTPTTNTPRKMFKGFFDQFKKFKYLGCSVSLVPAARLPVDPLQVSYDAGEPTIDPRDMLNPIMFHGCHGNDLGVILNRLYATNSTNAITSDSVNFMQLEDYNFSGNDYPIGADNLESLYYKALVDKTWKKAHSQRGFKKNGLRPMLYQLATPYQMDGTVGLTVDGSSNVIMSHGVPDDVDLDLDLETAHLSGTATGTVDKTFKLMTPRLTTLGWLDTRNVLTTGATASIDSHLGVSDSSPSLADQINGAIADAVDSVNDQMVNEALLPEIYMGVILLPPAYKTEQYFRMIVNHHFAFKGFRGVSFSPSVEIAAYNDWNDMITAGDTGDSGDSGNDDPRPPTGGDAGGDTPTEPEVPTPSLTSFTLSDPETVRADEGFDQITIYHTLTDSNNNSYTWDNYTQYSGTIYQGFAVKDNKVSIVVAVQVDSNWDQVPDSQTSFHLVCGRYAYGFVDSDYPDDVTWDYELINISSLVANDPVQWLYGQYSSNSRWTRWPSFSTWTPATASVPGYEHARALVEAGIDGETTLSGVVIDDS